MNQHEIPRQPPIVSLRVTVGNNSSQMTSPRRQKQVSELETAATNMSSSPRIAPTDWKLRFDNLKYEQQLELERLRSHYEHELKEKLIGK